MVIGSPHTISLPLGRLDAGMLRRETNGVEAIDGAFGGLLPASPSQRLVSLALAGPPPVGRLTSSPSPVGGLAWCEGATWQAIDTVEE